MTPNTNRTHSEQNIYRKPLGPQEPLAGLSRLQGKRFPFLLFAWFVVLSPLHAADSKGLLLVANKGEHTLSIVDTTGDKILATLEEDGITGHEVVASLDGKFAYVPIYGNSGVGKPGTDGSLLRVIDIPNREVVGTVDFGKGVRPHCAVMGPKNGLLYVTTELEYCITIIDPKKLHIVGTIPTGQPESHMLAITRDGKRGYTSNVGPGTVSVLDMDSRNLITIIPISKHAQRISLSVDDKFVFTADQTSPQLAVIDTATNGIRQWISLPGKGYGTAPTPDGQWLLVAMNETNQVGIINLATMKLVKSLDVLKSPQEIVVQPDGAKAYVSCDASQKVAVIDTKDWKVEKYITTGPGTDGLAWAVK